MKIVIDKSFRNEPAAQEDYEEEIDFDFFSRVLAGQNSSASAACRFEVESQSPDVSIPDSSIVLVASARESRRGYQKCHCIARHPSPPDSRCS